MVQKTSASLRFIPPKQVWVAIIAFAITMPSWGQEKPKKRSGWSVMPIPTVSYTSDNGLMLGALADIYYYGPERCNFPKYDHKFYVDFGWATKGSKYGYFAYDSEKLIPGLRFTTSAQYLTHDSFPFMGFNGWAAPYLEDMYHDAEGKMTGFYQMRKDMLRILVDFKGDIVPGLRWAAGLNIWDIRIKDTKLPMATNSLLHRYIDAGILSAGEAAGGFHTELKAGISYDTRDTEAATKSGIWADAFLYGSPDFVQKRNHYLNLALHWRHYVPLVKDKLTFAYHVAFQGTLLGEMPFYMLSNIAALSLRQVISDGLGSYNTLRGTLYNRMLGQAYAWSNFELRWFIYDFKLWGINLGIAINPLMDLGMVVVPYRLDRMRSSGDAQIFRDGGWSRSGDKLHMSYGGGAKLSVDYNFILSVEYATPVIKNDGPGSLSISVNYIF